VKRSGGHCWARGIAPAAPPATAQPASSGMPAAAGAGASAEDKQRQEQQQQQQLRRQTLMVHAAREWVQVYNGRLLTEGCSRPKVIF